MIVTRREFLCKQAENKEKMKKQELQRKLIEIQKPIDEQSDKKMSGKLTGLLRE